MPTPSAFFKGVAGGLPGVRAAAPSSCAVTGFWGTIQCISVNPGILANEMSETTSQRLWRRTLSALAALVFVGGAFWMSQALPAVPSSASKGTPGRTSPAPLPSGRLRLTAGPRIERDEGGTLHIVWRTNRPASSFAAYGRGNSAQNIIGVERTLVEEHRFEVPPELFIEFMRFQVMSVSETGEEVAAELGPGGGGRCRVFQAAEGADDAADALGPARALAWADYNDDGLLDAAACRTEGDQTELVIWDGTGRVAHRRTLPPVTVCRSLIWADFNEDRRLDLLMSGSRLTLYLNGGPPDWSLRKVNVFVKQGQGGVARSVVTDVNADGLPDVMAVTGEGRLVCYVNGGAPAYEFEPRAIGAAPGGGKVGGVLIMADFNGDGRPDICCGRQKPVLLLNTPGGYQPLEGAFPRIPLPLAPGMWAEPADWDGDGDLDLFIGGAGRNHLLRNDGTGRFEVATAQAAELAGFQGHTWCGAWSDLDGNGYPDLLMGLNEGGLKVFLNDGNGRFMDAVGLCDLRVPVASAPLAVAALDLNADAAPVLCVLFEDGHFTLRENRWWERPGENYLKVRHAGARGAWGAVTSLHSQVSDEPYASVRPGASGRQALAVPLESCFGIKDLRAATVKVRFGDGKDRSLSWVRGKASAPVLTVRYPSRLGMTRE